jgi:cytochrome o ubiquinol oxidase subunit 1
VVPVLWTIGFMVTFVLGGLTGVLLAVPLLTGRYHSLFLVAHSHHVIILGVVFASSPATCTGSQGVGFTLDERWVGVRSVVVHRLPCRLHAHVVGLMGMTRRMQHYDVLSWQPWLRPRPCCHHFRRSRLPDRAASSSIRNRRAP